MTLKLPCGIMLVPGLLTLAQLHFSASSGTSTREFSILPNSNTPCPMRPCYTLSQVMDNPSHYFTSNTTVVFLPGYHEVSTEGQLVIQNVNNISLVGDSTIMRCIARFGLAFINITNLTVSKLSFSMCGAPMANASQLPANLSEMLYVRTVHMFSIYLVSITNLTTTQFGIFHSRGMGLLGVNIFGVSSIQQAVFVNNTPNCAIVFLDSYSPVETPVLYITNSSFMFGTVSTFDYTYNRLAAGLSIIAIQNTYFVKGYIRVVTAYGNTGIIYGNMLLRINCKVAIQVTQLNCTGGYYIGFALEFKEDFNNCISQVEVTSHFYMSHSCFGRNSVGGSMYLHSIIYSVCVRLKNITVENNSEAFLVSTNPSSVLIMENVNINHNLGPLVIASFKQSSMVEFHGSNTFADNNYTDSAYAALHLIHCSVTFHGNTTFLENKHRYHNGGAIYADSAEINVKGIVVLMENEGEYGGALYAKSADINFQGRVEFLKNKGRYGGAIYAEDTRITFQGNMKFMENEGEYGGALVLYQNVSVVIGQFAEVSFVRNCAQESGGAVYARDSQIVITVRRKLLFVENEGYDGGAMTLTGDSTLYLEANSTVVFASNHAFHYGGAICYVDDYKEDFGSAAELSKCFYGIISTEITFKIPPELKDIFNYTKKKHISIEFHNNTAGFVGTAIYGGWVDLCKFHTFVMKYRYSFLIRNHEPDISQTSIFDSLFHFHQPTQQLSLISSNPTRVCLCTNMSIPDCSITEYTITAYPGETLTIPAVAVGQRFGTVPSTVHSKFVSGGSGRLPGLQYTQLVNVNCTDLSYTILSSPNKTEVMKLTVEKHNIPNTKVINEALQYTQVNKTSINLQFSELTVHIEVLLCPLGFVFDNSSQTCICHHKLQQHEINCSINTQTVYRKNPLWINATFFNETYTQVLVHNHCPFDYCEDRNIQLNMEYPDEQCALSRSGILCGSCQQNLSHVLGTSNCKECSPHFLLLIPIFIAAGIVLVVFLMLFNLTISVGTISGLIFYANIVRANQAIFFPPGTSNQFLSTFIAWLNLDLGIETCFYSGLDAYAKTWLQFPFPVYIWIIVVLIIVSSHYSTTAAKLSGRNAVQVLATLFLLSYAKLLRITITAFSFTILEYPDGSIKRVWLYDGNVDYLKSKHIALFVAALLLLVFISLPYTVTLLFIQCLQYRSKYRILAWVRRLKPLFDAYTGPYKDKHRYWPGLLLVVRIVLFLVFSVNVFGDPAISLLTIIVTTFCILFFSINFGGIYKNIVLNFIEHSFFLNLGILSSATLFTTLTDRDQTAVVYTSVTIAFATFMIITVHHILVRVTKEQQRQRFTEWAILTLKTIKATVKGKNNQNNHIHRANFNQFIELREPLLESAT